jgi:C4-dicarboxylate-specific signal transduction histidine kinase
MARIAADSDSSRREGRGRRKDGSTFPLELSINRIQVAGQVFLAGLARDLSQQKTLEARLQQTHRMETIGQLAGGIAHDFNNLLMVVAGRCESLRNQHGLTDSQRASLDHIATAVDQAATLTARLLSFSRRPPVRAAAARRQRGAAADERATAAHDPGRRHHARHSAPSTSPEDAHRCHARRQILINPR